MLTYFLIGLLFVLLGLAGLQFGYLFYVDLLSRERKKYLRDLERRAERLATRLEAADARIAEQNAVLEKLAPEYFLEEESWADVIDER